MPPQKRFEFNLGRYLAPNENVEIHILSRFGQPSQVLEWGFSGPTLPDEWLGTAWERIPIPRYFSSVRPNRQLHPCISGSMRTRKSLCRGPKSHSSLKQRGHERGVEFYFRKYFSTWSGQRIIGESRHRNPYLPFVPSRIHRFNKDAKLLVVLRDPVERAVSHWWHWRSRKMEPLSLAEALRADIERIEAGHKFTTEEDAATYAKLIYQDFRSPHQTYLDSGYYAEQIERYLRFFGTDSLHVVFFEELIIRPQVVMEGIFRFLGVEPGYAAQTRYVPQNESPRGAWEHVDVRTLAWLVEHFEAHNRRLEELLGKIPREWTHRSRFARG